MDQPKLKNKVRCDYDWKKRQKLLDRKDKASLQQRMYICSIGSSLVIVLAFMRKGFKEAKRSGEDSKKFGSAFASRNIWPRWLLRLSISMSVGL